MTFITLAKVTPQGWKELEKGLPQECYKAIKSAYVVYGRFDLVIIWDAPSIEEANRIIKHFVKVGAFTSETLIVASSLEDFKKY